MRAHISLPKELVEEIDELAGPRKRSQFIEDAIRHKLLNERQKQAMKEFEASGGLKGDYPYWRTPEDVSRWVRELRELDNKRLERKLRNLPS